MMHFLDNFELLSSYLSFKILYYMIIIFYKHSKILMTSSNYQSTEKNQAPFMIDITIVNVLIL